MLYSIAPISSSAANTDHYCPMPKIISYEYIRGLVDGEGCFTFCQGWRMRDGRKMIFPTFEISMHERDQDLIQSVRNTLKLKNRVYNYKSPSYDGIVRGRKAILIVRDFPQLKDIIIPLFYKKLHGYKGFQFMNWMERIGYDQGIDDRFRSLYRLYKWGIFDKPEFMDRFR